MPTVRQDDCRRCDDRTDLGRGDDADRDVGGDYLPDKKMMKPKGPFQVRVSKGIFDKLKITAATLHQPILDNNTQSTDVNVSTKLSIRDDGESLIITVPFLDLWGIVEFTSS